MAFSVKIRQQLLLTLFTIVVQMNLSTLNAHKKLLNVISLIFLERNFVFKCLSSLLILLTIPSVYLALRGRTITRINETQTTCLYKVK